MDRFDLIEALVSRLIRLFDLGGSFLEALDLYSYFLQLRLLGCLQPEQVKTLPQNCA